jgi:hypothetical protein
VTLKDFIKNHPDAWSRVRSSAEWKKTEADVRALDYVMGNVDRFPNSVYREGNLANLLVPNAMKTGADVEVVLIDNGVGRPGNSDFHVGNVSPGVSNALRQAFLDFDAESFRRGESQWLPADGIDDVISRIRKIREMLR